MIELLIIADDYTGSLDTGVQFAQCGFATYVTSHEQLDLQELPDGTQVLVVDAQSRHIAPRQAYERVWRLARQAAQLGAAHLYIKIDSTLRGNVGSYLSAALDACGSGCTAVLAPALPSLGRTTTGGRQYVAGQPLGEAEIARDPFNPVRSSYIPEILLEQSAHRAVCLRPDELCPARIGENRGGILVLDAEHDADLEQIAKTALAAPQVVMAGSAGFAATLAACMRRPGGKTHDLFAAKRVLVLCGSLNSTSIQQICMAEHEGMPVITLTARQKKDASYLKSAEADTFLDAAAHSLRQEGRLALCVASDPAQAACLDGEEADLHRIVADNVGRLAAAVMDRAEPDTVVIFGGDTLASFLAVLGVRGIRPVRELLPGVVLSQMQRGGKTILLITKSGAFGERDTLVSLLRKF